MTRAAALALVTALSGCITHTATREEPQLRAATNPVEMRALRADLIETYVRSGAVELAAPLVREALRDEPKSARLLVLLGAILLDRGLVGQAQEQARAALAFDDTYAAAYALQGRVEQRRGRPEAAIIAHQRATELQGGCVRCWNNLGYSLFLAGRDREAVTAYETALKLDPNARTIYNNLGFAYGRLGDDRAALSAFRQALGEADAAKNLELAHALRSAVATPPPPPPHPPKELP